LQTSQGYIIRILQHFATKLWNITNFVMLFQAVTKFLSRLVEIKILSITQMVNYMQTNCSAFPVCVWTMALFAFLAWSFQWYRTFLKRQCCAGLLLISIACWSCSTIISSVAKTQTLQAHLLVHRVANASEANLRCVTWAVNFQGSCEFYNLRLVILPLLVV
jgi:hypothetical protein